MNFNSKDTFLLLTLQSFLENSQDMIFVKDENLVYVTVSQTFLTMTGNQSSLDVVGKTDFDFFEPALAKKYTEDDRRILARGVALTNYIEPLPDKDGKKKYSSTSKYLIRDPDGKIIGLYGIARDVTAQIELEAERESSRLSRQMFDSVLEADVNLDQMLRFEGGQWVRALDLVGRSSFSETIQAMAAGCIHPDFQQNFLARYDNRALRENFDNGMYEFSHITSMQVRDNCYRWFEWRSKMYHSHISNTLRVTSFLMDIDEEIRSKQRLQKKATTDALTGLFNRASILEQITASLAQKGDSLCALLFIDLDCFKQVNDLWGHPFGDTVLRRMADRLRQVFTAGEFLGRVGGDEFLVFVRQVPTRQELLSLAEQAVRTLSVYHKNKNDEVQVTCSVGIACRSGDGVTVEELYACADKAMYQAKNSGRNRIAFYEDLPQEASGKAPGGKEHTYDEGP